MYVHMKGCINVCVYVSMYVGRVCHVLVFVMAYRDVPVDLHAHCPPDFIEAVEVLVDE